MFKRRRKNKKVHATITYEKRKLKRNMVCKPEYITSKIEDLTLEELSGIKKFINALIAETAEKYLIDPASFRLNGMLPFIITKEEVQNFQNTINNS